jgi:protein ImuB
MYAALHAPGGADPVRLLLCASDFSPRVEQTAPATAVIAVGGLAHLFGSAREIGEAIARRAAELDLAVNVALAPNPDLAVHGARGFAGVTVMTAGREAALPVDLLEPAPIIADTLALWGIRTFGDFAALPSGGVGERLGAEGVRLQKLARGSGDRPLIPTKSTPRFEESLDLEDPLTLLEPLAFVLGRLLGSVCARLDSHGLATHELRLTLTLEGAEPHQRTLRFPYPMRDSRVFLKLLTLDLERHPPAAPILAVALAAEPVNPRVLQHGLFVPPAPEPQKLELTLARILKIVGEGNAGSPALLDTHRPRAFQIGDSHPFHQFNLSENKDDRIGERGDCPRFALRLFRPALPAEVQAPHGFPERVRARGVRGHVLESAGPWRTSGDWWSGDAWSRDEWDVELSDGALYILYLDHRENRWFLEGAYD